MVHSHNISANPTNESCQNRRTHAHILWIWKIQKLIMRLFSAMNAMRTPHTQIRKANWKKVNTYTHRWKKGHHEHEAKTQQFAFALTHVAFVATYWGYAVAIIQTCSEHILLCLSRLLCSYGAVIINISFIWWKASWCWLIRSPPRYQSLSFAIASLKRIARIVFFAPSMCTSMCLCLYIRGLYASVFVSYLKTHREP